MRAQTLPGAAGWRWFLGGIIIYRRNPSLLAMLVIAYWFTILLLNIVPILGTLVASLAIPGLSVGLMQACRNLEHGQPSNLSTLFGSLNQNRRSLMGLGALYLFCTLGILGVSALADGGELLQFMLGAKEPSPDSVAEGGTLLSSLIVLTLLVPLLMAYWFAPVLAAWHGLSVAKSLFFSFVACWLNWRPFFSYSCALFLFAALLPGTVLGLLLLIVPQAQQFAAALITAPMVLIIAPITFASFYVSYRDVFGFSASA